MRAVKTAVHMVRLLRYVLQLGAMLAQFTGGQVPRTSALQNDLKTPAPVPVRDGIDATIDSFFSVPNDVVGCSFIASVASLHAITDASEQRLIWGRRVSLLTILVRAGVLVSLCVCVCKRARTLLQGDATSAQPLC